MTKTIKNLGVWGTDMIFMERLVALKKLGVPGEQEETVIFGVFTYVVYRVRRGNKTQF